MNFLTWCNEIAYHLQHSFNELTIANILSIEQVLVCRMLLYSPPQAGYGTSCDESCLGG